MSAPDLFAVAPRFHWLHVREVRRETPDAISVTFAIPPELQPLYKFRAGQYLTLRTTLDGEEVRRSYSICSGADDGELRIAIKQVEGGMFSVWALEDVAARRGSGSHDANRTVRHSSAAGGRARACRVCRRVRHYAFAVDYEDGVVTGAGQPFLPVLRQPGDGRHLCSVARWRI